MLKLQENSDIWQIFCRQPKSILFTHVEANSRDCIKIATIKIESIKKGHKKRQLAELLQPA
ncbi:hypothetical protein BpHYR1_040976 [Brachionus plicatilis]|uniref:Uncharacterized protein n=1 Tax=Brachionus plicatilis TaxID=10195 RepID=A0A3M7SEE8_BRAPC|nr:hypothetical protein BpHYR1_040976 [Brachionus plicatilis]